jgi:hypothetical protein
MNIERGRRLAAVLCMAGLAFAEGGALAAPAPASAKPATPSPATYRDLKWEELIPKGWDPAATFKGRDTSVLNDWDPRARKLMKEVKDVWDHAPTVSTLNGSQVRIPGYVVPLETVRGALKEFLLVPYFGACIHVPPPPANQIIFVVPKSPAEGFRTMDTVWVTGTLSATRVESFAGSSGYRIDAAVVEPYVGKSGQ